MSELNRRVARVCIPAYCMLDLFLPRPLNPDLDPENENEYASRIGFDAPDDAELLDVHFDHASRCWWLTIHSPELDEITDGEVIPKVAGWIETVSLKTGEVLGGRQRC